MLRQTRACPTPRQWEKEIKLLWLPQWPLSQAHPPCSFLFGAHCHSGSHILAVVPEGHPQIADKWHRHFCFLDSSTVGSSVGCGSSFRVLTQFRAVGGKCGVLSSKTAGLSAGAWWFSAQATPSDPTHQEGKDHVVHPLGLHQTPSSLYTQTSHPHCRPHPGDA